MPDKESDRSPSDGHLNEEFEYCASCGTTLPKDKWCPIVTETDAEGDLVVRSFCDEHCKDAWTNNEASETT